MSNSNLAETGDPRFPLVADQRTAAVAEPARVTHMRWVDVLPYVDGSPLTEERARALWSFLAGGTYVDWRQKAIDHPENRSSHERAARDQDDDIRAAATAFLCIVKRFLGAGAPGLTLHLLDGRVVDWASLDVTEARRAMGLRG